MGGAKTMHLLQPVQSYALNKTVGQRIYTKSRQQQVSLPSRVAHFVRAQQRVARLGESVRSGRPREATSNSKKEPETKRD